MARVTIEDCIDKIENRFDLVLLASYRARQIVQGDSITVDRDNDKNPVVALRGIADETLSPGDLNEALIHSLQKQVEVDEPDEDMQEFAGRPKDVAELREERAVSFERMSEEDLLAGIEGCIPPEKGDDF